MKCNKKTFFTLITIVSFCCLTILVISIIILEHFSGNFKKIYNNTCLTEQCNKTASNLLFNMNLKADPCVDFYEFSCGNFVKNMRIGDANAYVMLLNINSSKIQRDLRDILEEPPLLNDIEPFVLIKKLYYACMNETNIQMKAVNKLVDILNHLGGWPVLHENWKAEYFDWINTTINVGKIGYGTHSIIQISVDFDARNNSKMILCVDQPVLELNREFLIKGLQNEIVETYFDYMINVSVYFGANRSLATRDLLDILSLEKELANISLSNEERQNVKKLYNLITVKELQKTYPFIPWLKFINNILPSSIQINDSEIMLNAVPDYLHKLELILKNTSKRTLANYILWNVVRESIPYLSKNLTMIKDKLNAKLTGQIKETTRWQKCISSIQEDLPVALGSLYVRKHFKKESKIQIEGVIKHLKKEFKNILQHTDWMDSKTKMSALEKINALNAFVAYPEELLDDNKIIEYYKNLTINEDLYLDSVLNISIYLRTKVFNELRMPFNENKWARHSHTFIVDAYYSTSENSLELPAAILQILYSSECPTYMNYGKIGFVVGHEMTHGFDNYGRQFDKNGNLVDWWEKPANDAFLRKAQCIIKQYGNYTIENMPINGINTLGENIADNGAIQIAYNAYIKWLEIHEEQTIYGFNFTAKQMFWISAANLWCAKYRPEFLKVYLATDSHSPGRFRVNGVVSNQIKFAEDFNCKLGTKMNPLHKCKVW